MKKTINLPEISNWINIGDKLIHELGELTNSQIKILNKFVSKHNNFYICVKENKYAICKLERISM